MTKSVIDFEVLEQYIKEIEDIFKKNNLNIVEQDLVLRQAHARLNKKIEEQKAQDMLQNMPVVGSLLNRFRKDNEE